MRTGIPVTTKIILAILAFLVFILVFLMFVRFDVISINLPDFRKSDKVKIVAPIVDENKLVVEVNKETELFSGPGEEYNKIGVIDNGTQVSVLGKSIDGNWLAVSITTDTLDVGWIAASDIVEGFVDNSYQNKNDGSLTTGEPTIVANSDVDVFNGPGVRYEVLGQLLENQEAQVLCTKQW